MSAFSDMQDLLADFLTEASDLLDDVDIGLVDLEQRPDDTALLNQIFRGFHTVKGGAGFLDATPLVELCHRGENLLDLLRGQTLAVTPEIMDVILAATGEVRRMFAEMERGAMPEPAPQELLDALEAAARGERIDTTALRGMTGRAPEAEAPASEAAAAVPGHEASVEAETAHAAGPAEAAKAVEAAAQAGRAVDGIDWLGYYRAAFGEPPSLPAALPAAAAAPAAGARAPAA
ncbi:Hpt domain-containing protein, partial [Pigmentiphaga soli]|uniref:Hpt domain-containing protein n=1 Tax=Pigmentiphaga soli TaxID=1007095 RepID=UPI0031E6966F